MSASKEKKNRQDQVKVGWSDPKTAREAKQRKEEKRNNLLYGVIAIVFVAVAVISITWKSGVVQRNATAVTIDGVKYSAAEVQYYYKTAYQNFVSNYSSYLSYFGLDTSKDLKSQTCTMSEDAGTWYDYFVKQGLTTMSSVHALYDAAQKDGFKWTDKMQSDYDDNMDSLKSSASNYNYTTEKYIQAIFGKIVTKDVYTAQLKMSILAQAYSTKYSDGLTYTTDQLKKAYTDDPNSYDVVDYESIKVDGTANTTASSSNSTGSSSSASSASSASSSSASSSSASSSSASSSSASSSSASSSSASSSSASSSSASSASSSSAQTEPTDEEKAAAMSQAKKTADSIYASYQAGKELSTLADTNDKATYTDGTGGTYSKSVLMDWLYDTSRTAGDSAVLADEDNSAYYVVHFIKRYRNNYDTVDVRHILIEPESGTLKEGDDGYDEEQAKLKAAAKQKAEDLLAQWKAGDATEDSFAQLAEKNSSDSGSKDNGGLYTQVYKGQMETAFNDWCFDTARKAGDTGIVETDYGYHVMYFVGTDLPYWQVQVTKALKDKDYNEWYSGLTKNYTAKQHSFGMKFVG